MGDGVRPKGAKSYAAMRSAEAMEAHRKDIADPRRCPKCGGEMAAGYHMIRTLDGASVIMVYDDNLKHAEDALLSTDARRHVEGVRILRAVRDRINAQAEAWMEVVLKCNCGHEEKVR